MTALRFLLNPAAGGGNGGSLLPRLLSAATREGASLVESRSGEHLQELARQASAEGVRRLVVAGGDGTLHHALQGLAGTATELALLPLGTGNDLAGSLAIPGQVEEALDLALAGSATPMDLGRVGDRYFSVYCGVGFDSEVSQWVAARGPEGRGKLVYIRGFFTKLLGGFEPPRIELEHDAGSWSGRAMLTVVANCPRFGGGMKIAPEANPTDGLLDLVYVSEVSRLQMLRIFPRVFRGTHVDHPAVNIHRTQSVRIRLDREMVMYADGEEVCPVGPAGVAVRVAPGAVRVVRP